MYLETNVVELYSKSVPLANDEDFIVLLDRDDDYICYVRNYVASTEFIVVSDSITQKLPFDMRPVTNVFLLTNFHVLKRFKNAIKNHVASDSALLRQFRYLFHCGIDELFNSF